MHWKDIDEYNISYFWTLKMFLNQKKEFMSTPYKSWFQVNNVKQIKASITRRDTISDLKIYELYLRNKSLNKYKDCKWPLVKMALEEIERVEIMKQIRL